MSVFAINATVGPEGLCPMLLIFGAIPRPARNTPSATQMERAQTIDHSMDEVIKIHAIMRLEFGLKDTGGPKGVENSDYLRQLPSGAHLLVFRTTTKKWEGPLTFISVDGKTLVFQTRNGRLIFLSTCVKPYVRSQLERDAGCYNIGDVHSEGTVRGKVIVNNNGTYAVKSYEAKDGPIGEETEANMVSRKARPDAGFTRTRTDELLGLLNEGTFKAVRKAEVPEITRILVSRFID